MFFIHPTFRVITTLWSFVLQKLGYHVPGSTELADTQGRPFGREERPCARVGTAWMPIEFADGVSSRVDTQHIVGVKRIAEGGFGRLCRTMDVSSGRSLVVKRVSKRLLGEEGEPPLLDEIGAHHRMDSDPRFPSLPGCFFDQQDYILVMVNSCYAFALVPRLIPRSAILLQRRIIKPYQRFRRLP
jgi:hypothetical protein